ncbi:zinc finger SWIM domain-containing protein 6 [Clonorchis sinensis]|uniref:Zinc finger SWIM domain-containing protein 6 n=1 Tax=Clonorchis sinensis TaxID=79923 RepID=G7YSR2_CLOSI|nr:zinc finger SWIM domain-containing protein 6 [Clonorchis sinensis]
MPKDTTTLLAVCEALSYLLGPPTLPRQLTRMDNSPGSPIVSWSLPNWCWWSALGPVIHPDSYPVHAVAHFVLDYIVEAQKQNQLTLVNNCWAGFGNTAPSVRMEDLLYAVVTRAMRFSALESVSDNLGLPSTAVNRGNFVTESTSHVLDHQSHQSRARTPFPQSHWDNNPHTFDSTGDLSSLATGTPVVPNPITSPMCFTRTQPTATHNPEQVPMVVYQQNGNLRRCLEMLERQQTQLAISLIRLSKSHVQRLDQTVQICDRHIHSAVSLLTISQQIFADAVGLDPAVSSTSNYDPVHLFKSSLLPGFGNGVCQLGSSSSASNVMLPTPTTHFGGGSFTRDRTNLISAAFYLALLVVLRTLSRTVHWRRREMLAWSASTALHVGPSACLYLVTHWSSYVSPREAVNWLAPTLLSVLNKSGSGVAPQDPKPNAKPADQTCVYHPVHCSEPSLCSEHALLFGYVNSDVYMSSDLPSPGVLHPSWPPWYGFSQAPLASRGHTNSIAMAAQLLSSAVPYSANARDHISAAVRTMAMQAAAKDPVNCALPALALAERSPTAFDAVYRLVLHSAGTGGLGPVQLFSLARYMDSRGWAWRAFPFALHATRLFVLSTMQDSHPVAGHVLWACSLAHRLGPGPLQELLNHVIRNIHCPTLLTEILYRCRIPPAGLSVNGPGVNPVNGAAVDLLSPSSLPPRNPPSNFGSSMPYYHLENGKLLSLDRPPLKCLLDAAINAFVTATHTRLSNISPRQYAEFVDFLTRARDTFHLLRPDGPAQFRSLVECLRQTYRGKRKLVSLLAERFG